MSALTESPLNYDFGEDFNYSSWDENTVLTLVNVPWNNDYRDIVRFSSRTARDSWINNAPNVTIQNVSLQKFAMNVQIDLPLNAALKYNYIRASNPLMNGVEDDAQRNYYYFITSVSYRSPNNTELTLQLDIWQTFGYEVSFGSCYVERGHIGIANENAFAHYGRDYLEEPEGLDIGSEYRIVHVESESVIGAGGSYNILVASSVELGIGTQTIDLGTATIPGYTVDMGEIDLGEYGTVDLGNTDMPAQQVDLGTITTELGGTKDNPDIVSANPTLFQGIPSGAGFVYFKTPKEFIAFMSVLKEKPWVSQGILSITAIPSVLRYHPGFAEKYVTVEGTKVYRPPTDRPKPRSTPMLSDWRNSDFIGNVLGDRYRNLKKFLTSPYMMVELTTFTGSPIVMKPEHWQDANATVREMAAFVPPGQRLVFTPSRYNADGETTGDTKDFANDDLGEFLDMAAALDNFPSLPIVNDMAINFLAANKHGLAFQFRTADWGQQRALRGAEVAYGQAEQGIGLENRLTQIGVNATTQQANLQTAMAMPHALVSGVGGIAGGFLAGGPAGAGVGAAGAAAGMANAGLDMVNTQMSAGIRNAAAQQSNQARVGTSQYMADTNRSMAQYAARGDYQNAVAGVNAKIQDAALLQPSTSGQFGGDAFNIINRVFGYSVRWKMINNQAIKRIGDYWLRYGYAVHQFMQLPTNLQVMEKFTYWKLSETYISQGMFPEAFKQAIRGIFEKGVTVWSNPSDIGNIDWADNDPLTGISY